MPDNSVQLSSEEQKYFDTGGEAEISQETPATEPSEPVVEKAPKVAKKVSRETKSREVAQSEPQEAVEETAPVVTKTPEQEKMENLEAALREERRISRENERRTEERLRLLQQVVEQPKQQQAQPEIPDPEKDPMGALKHLLGKVRQGEQVQQQTLQQQHIEQQNHRVMGEASRLETEFLAQQPDYDRATGTSPSYNEASSFLVNMRKAELAVTGAYNPMQINEILKNEAISLAQQAMQTGRNPGQVIFDIAKARGFAPKPRVAQETEAEKITRIGKGQEAGFSLGQAAGSKPSTGARLDAKTLASMSDDDFTAFVNKAKKSDLRHFMGD